MNGVNAASPPTPMSAMAPPPGPSPTGAPAQEGMSAQADVKLQTVVKSLLDVLNMLRSELNSPRGKAVLGALRTLAPHTPDVQEGLSVSQALSDLARAQSVRPGQSPSMLGIGRPRPNVMAGPPMGGAPMGGAPPMMMG